MSTHLLPISAEWLARLPYGVLVDGFGRTTGRMYGSATEVEVLAGFAGLGPLALDLTDTVTAAAVAAKVAGPWLDTDPDRRVDVPCGMSVARSIADAAVWMDPLTADQTEALARLARAAMEER